MVALIDKYIKEKKTVRQKTWDNIRLVGTYWQISVSSALFILLGFWIWRNTPDKTLSEIINLVVNAASIMSAVLITFLVAKVIQIRQEKMSALDDYHRWTQKMHEFRGAIYPLYTTYDFWPAGLKYDMEHKYKSLSHYEIRKATFVDGTPSSELATEFSKTKGGPARLYLDLKSFFTGRVPHDITMFKGEFDSFSYFDLEQLELWYTFDNGNGLFYYFDNKYALYKTEFNFHKISIHDQEKVIEHCLRIDPRRYRNVKFGRDLYVRLGNQFASELLPKLILASRIVHGSLPSPVNFLNHLLMLLIPIGILLPFLTLLDIVPLRCVAWAASGTVALLFYLMVSLHQLLGKEIVVHR